MKVIFYMLIIIFLLSGCNGYKHNKMEESKELFNKTDTNLNEQVIIPIIINDYTYIERNLIVNDFLFIKKGINMEEVKNTLGEPNGTVGFGISRYYYHLHDKSAIIIYEDINGVYGVEHCTFNLFGGTKKAWILAP